MERHRLASRLPIWPWTLTPSRLVGVSITKCPAAFGVAVEPGTVLTGDFQPRARAVVVVKTAVGNSNIIRVVCDMTCVRDSCPNYDNNGHVRLKVASEHGRLFHRNTGYRSVSFVRQLARFLSFVFSLKATITELVNIAADARKKISSRLIGFPWTRNCWHTRTGKLSVRSAYAS